MMRVFPEEPGALTGHARIRGVKVTPSDGSISVLLGSGAVGANTLRWVTEQVRDGVVLVASEERVGYRCTTCRECVATVP